MKLDDFKRTSFVFHYIYVPGSSQVLRDAFQCAVSLSVFVWGWPEDIADKLSAWEQLGVERTFLTFWHPFDTLPRAVDLMS